MLAGDDQIQGLKLKETETTTYTYTEHLLGSDSASNPIELHLRGPIVGFLVSYMMEFDGLTFDIDTTYCYRSQINSMNLDSLSTALGEELTIDMTPTSGAFHELGGRIFSNDPCSVAYVLGNSENNLFTLSGSTGYIGAKWTQDSSTILGSEVGTYTGWTVLASYSAFPDIVSYKLTRTFDVIISPTCGLS